MATHREPIETPTWFKLRTVVFSHGWYDLPPFAWDEEKSLLSTLFTVAKRVVLVEVTSSGKKQITLALTTPGRIGSALIKDVSQRCHAMLGLDQDFSAFYRLAGPEYAWARRRGAGPFLRGGSAFEDAVKMLATTNCSWALTRQMMQRLIERLGPIGPNDRRAFPTPAMMAEQDESFFVEEVRAGYRSRFMSQFSRAVAGGEIDCEGWPRTAAATHELVTLIRQAPGFGPYAAENLCKLFGRYDGLGLDSWCLAKFPKVHGPVRGDVRKAIEKRYARFGEWRGLALWLDLTRDWHEEHPVRDESVSFKKR